MSKKIILRLTQSINFRDVVVGLGIIITILVLLWMRDGLASLFRENNFLQNALFSKTLKTISGLEYHECCDEF